ncbi:AlbA family DNA-binding domain-containing protein [Actinomyces sp.]
MFTPIHRALGLEAGNASIDLIQQAIDHGVEETSDLDWKQAVYNSRKPNWDEEAAKDIAAMANSGGGWIVFGIKEGGDTNAASEIIPIEWSAAEQQRILRTAYAKVGPPVIGIEFYDIPCGDEGGGSVVMMRVPDSADAPHFARKGDNAFVAPRRNGPHTVYMSDREIERGFRERFQHVDDREGLLQDRFERACEALRPEDGVFFAVAAVPYEPVTGREPGVAEQVYRYTDEPLLPQREGVRALKNWWEGGEIKKGLHQWVLRARRGVKRKFRKYFCDDASYIGAYQLGLLITDEQWSDKYPVGLPNHCRAIDVQTALIDCITMLRRHAQERQAHGEFRMRAGLVGIAGKPIVIREDDDWAWRLRDADDMEPIMRFQPITIELDPLVEIEELLPVINDLARDLVSQGGVEHL